MTHVCLEAHALAQHTQKCQLETLSRDGPSFLASLSEPDGTICRNPGGELLATGNGGGSYHRQREDLTY